MKYKTIEELIGYIEGPAKTVVFDIYHKQKALFEEAQGSVHNHQAWIGGYIDHVSEVMNIARLIYPIMNDRRKLPFTISDVLIVLFLHDIEKTQPDRIQSYVDKNMNRPQAKDRVRFQMFHEKEYSDIYNLLTNSQKNAIDYVEGEKEEYHNSNRTMKPLAAFCHICDIISARIWFDNPTIESESWGWRESTCEQ